jgi:hypothetical protein
MCLINQSIDLTQDQQCPEANTLRLLIMNTRLLIMNTRLLIMEPHN